MTPNKIVVIIPSRYGSSRFEGKPLALIAGRPMIQWVYERAGRARNITDIVVATDDQRIYDAVTGFGGRAVMTSPINRSGTDRVAEAAGILGLAPEDLVINIQGDQPLIDPECLDDLVMPFISDAPVDMSTLAYKIINKREITDPKDVKVTFNVKGDALYFSRSPIPFARDAGTRFDTYKHLGVYAYTRRFLEIFRNLPEGTLERIEKLEQLRALEHGYSIRVVVTPYDSPEVDLPEDIQRIEAGLRAMG
ncbi:MAG: 3-deoxy-manno-octulosonate cytidylyltransferase [Desulfobacterales bacterium]|nr:3-deoxy-manno-octulosonate cytidylyltransferase [Desulfobacterales bacterium]